MSLVTRDTVKTWFETGDKPTQAQFYDWIDSVEWWDFPKVLAGGLEYTGSPSDVPVISVQKNTIGGVPVMSRIGTGSYRLTLTGLLPVGKTFVTFGNGLSGVSLRGGRINDNVVTITTSDSLDYVLSGASVIINVYP